ncbi:hypothetical protein AAMO2058_000429900 [Amorphochlora amoebiformis]
MSEGAMIEVVGDGGDGKGRRLVATRNIREGVTLLMEEPISHATRIDFRLKRCEWCLSSKQPIKRCSKCKLIGYCSRNCQVAAWKAYHKHECKCMVGLPKRLERLPATALIAGRIILAGLSSGTDAKLPEISKSSPMEKGLAKVGKKAKIRDISLLDTLWEKKATERKMYYAQQAMTLMNYLKPAIASLTSAPTANNMAALLSLLDANSYVITDPEMDSIACGVYSVLSMINHSCSPNAIVMFRNKTGQLRTVKSIKKGEEICVSYLDLISTPRERRRNLLECQCSRCAIFFHEKKIKMSADESMDEKLSKLLEGKEKSLEKVKSSLEAAKLGPSDSKRALSLSRQALSEAKAVCGPYHAYVIRAYKQIWKQAMYASEMEISWEYGRKTLPLLEFVYNSPNPVYAADILFHARVCWYLQKVEEALEYYKKAAKVLKITHGEEDKMTKECHERICVAQAEIAAKAQALQ